MSKLSTPDWVYGLHSFCPSLLRVSLLLVSASMACCPFPSETAAASLGRAVVTGGLMAGLWQAQQGSSSLHQIKAPAAAPRDAERMSTCCRGGDSFQASCRQLELRFTTAEPSSPAAPWPRARGWGSQLHRQPAHSWRW